SRARSLKCNQNNVYASWRANASLPFITDPETMRKIQCFSWRQILLNSAPPRDLSGITYEKLENGAVLTGFCNFKKGLAGNPAIGNSLVPSLGVFPLTYDDIKSVILKVKCLTRSLNSVTQNGNHFILQSFLGFLKRKFFSCYYIFFNCTELQFHSF